MIRPLQHVIDGFEEEIIPGKIIRREEIRRSLLHQLPERNLVVELVIIEGFILLHTGFKHGAEHPRGHRVPPATNEMIGH